MVWFERSLYEKFRRAKIKHGFDGENFFAQKTDTEELNRMNKNA